MRSLSLPAALVLAVCFVLPLSTCTRYVDEQGEAVEVEDGETPPEGAVEIVDHQIAAEQLFTNPLGGALMLIFFVGPLASAFVLRGGASARAKRVLFWLQPLLLLGAGHAIWVVGRFGETAPAAWVGAAAVAVLAVAWIAALLDDRAAPA
jgi:hypothetical protein